MEFSVDAFVQQIRSGESSWLQLVECLGPQLTHEDPFERAKGIEVMANVLEATQDVLSSQQLPVVVRFFMDRLKDQQSVADGLRALVSIAQSKHFQANDASALAVDIVQKYSSYTLQNSISQKPNTDRLFAEINVQNFVQTTRMLVFRLLTVLLTHHTAGIRSAMGREFVAGFIQAIDGEKDPRNLLMAFRLAYLVTCKFDVEELAEDLFEVVSCYFPITFRPPPGDPYGIQAQDLKVELKNCLVASRHFTPFAIPLFMEKLSSSASAARRDALDVMKESLPVYGVLAYEAELTPIWKAIQKILFDDKDAENESIALEFITAVAQHLTKHIGVTSTDPQGKDNRSLLETFITMIWDDVKKIWKQDEASLHFKCSVRLVGSVLKASNPAAEFMSKRFVPVWLERYRTPGVKRKLWMDALHQLLLVCPTPGEADFHCWFELKDDLMEAITSALYQDADPQLGSVALECLTECMLQSDLLDRDEMSLATENLTQYVLTNAADRTHSYRCLVRVASLAPERAEPVISQLKQNVVGAASPEILQDALTSLQQLSSCAPLSEDILTFLCTTQIPLQDFPMVLDAVAAVTETAIDEKRVDMARVLESFLLTILRTTLEAIHFGGSLPDTFVPRYANACAAILQRVSTDAQRSLAGTILAVFHGDLSAIGMDSTSIPFRPLLSPNSELLPVFAAVLCNLRPACAYLNTDAELVSLLEELLPESLTEATPQVVVSLFQVAASFLNKAPAAFTEHTVDFVIPRVLSMTSQTVLGVEACVWVTKALVMRGHPRSSELIQHLMTLLKQSEDHAMSAANGFGVIMSDHGSVLSKKNFAVQKLLYRQRFFNECIPKLEESFRSAKEGHKRFFLIALSHVLASTPKKILLGSLQSLLPLLFQSLHFEDAVLKQNTLDTFQLILKESPLVLQSHAYSLIKALLGMCVPPSRMDIRIAALKCLTLVSSLPYETVYPHRSAVTRSLVEVLDDPKRLVRQEAVLCRNKWFLLVGGSASNK